MQIEESMEIMPTNCVKNRRKSAIKRKSTKPVTPKNGGKKRKMTPKNNDSRRVLKVTKRVTKTKTTTTVTKTRTPIQKRKSYVVEVNAENKVVLKQKNFRAWKDDQFVIDTLIARGWSYLGEPVHDGREDYPHSLYEAKEKGQIAPDDCLYWADDDDSKVLLGFSERHLISSIPYADRALTKVFQQEMFQEYEWFPKCFTLPKERPLLLEYIRQNPNSYWITKPKNSYGGFGMVVYRGTSELFVKTISDRKTTFVVQKYMSNPYLFAGLYKFHLRCYLTVTNVCEPFKAYLWKNAQIQFSTHPFDLTRIESQFNKYSHITNFKVNNEKKNKEFVCKDKPGIGTGTEWSIARFFQYMNQHEPKFSEERFWNDLLKISKVVATKLMSNKHIAKGLRHGASVKNHFEVYGLDLLMDEHCNLALTEANTQPGLDYSSPTLPDGSFQPEVLQANDITRGIINDTLTLLGVDEGREYYSPFLPLHDTDGM